MSVVLLGHACIGMTRACIDPHGYDAGKKIKGKKRHILVDTLGLLLHAIVHPADIQDRDGGVLVMATLFGMFPFLKTLFADSGYQGPKFAKALAKVLPHLDIEIVKRSDQVSGFVVLPKRWIVERTIAWLNRCRRLSRIGRISTERRSRSCARLNPPHAQKTMQSSLKSPDGL
jgi:transposase